MKLVQGPSAKLTSSSTKNSQVAKPIKVLESRDSANGVQSRIPQDSNGVDDGPLDEEGCMKKVHVIIIYEDFWLEHQQFLIVYFLGCHGGRDGI